jgi:hypothetical protein
LSFLRTRPSSRNSEEKAVERTVLRRSCTQDHRTGTRKRKQSREPFFVVPAHKTVEQELGRESSRENRSSSFLDTKTIKQQFGEEPAERETCRSQAPSTPSQRSLDEITDSGDTIKSSVRIRTKDERDQADQMCRLLPTNEGSAKPTEYGPRTPLRGGPSFRKDQRETRAQMQSNRESKSEKKPDLKIWSHTTRERSPEGA